MATDQTNGTEEPKVTPDQYRTTTPPGLQAADHSWVLQTIMELRGSFGKLEGTVQGLERTVQDQTKEMKGVNDSIGEVKENLTKIVTTASVLKWVLGGIGALLGIFLYRLPPIITSIREFFTP